MRKNRSDRVNLLNESFVLALSSPLSLYVHIPFCVRKCPYCAFYSVVSKASEIDKFMNCLDEELKLWAALTGGKIKAQTLYIGGGTPTLLNHWQWERLISSLERYVDFLPFLEASVEANPGSLSADHIKLWRSWRITRVSLGVQSLDDGELQWLKRPHSAHDAADAIAALVASGLDVSVDLIFGLPGQTIQSWHRTLKDCLNFGIRHLSIYELTLEEGTPWGDCPPSGLTEGYPLYRFAQWYLPKKGFIQYEIASFSLPRHWCRHNIAYWQGKNFLGVGPSAWGYLDGFRYGNTREINDYFYQITSEKLPVAYREILPQDRQAMEAAILALRTRWGVTATTFKRKYGWKVYRKFLDTWMKLPSDCKTSSRGRHAFTSKGFRIANALWENFL